MFRFIFNCFPFSFLYWPIFFPYALHVINHQAFFQTRQSITHPIHPHHLLKVNQLFFEEFL